MKEHRCDPVNLQATPDRSRASLVQTTPGLLLFATPGRAEGTMTTTATYAYCHRGATFTTGMRATEENTDNDDARGEEGPPGFPFATTPTPMRARAPPSLSPSPGPRRGTFSTSLPTHREERFTSKGTSPNEPRRFHQREKQLSYGLETVGYKNMIRLLAHDPLLKSGGILPLLPPSVDQGSKRSWDIRTRKWRRDLHMFDYVFIDGVDDEATRAAMLEEQRKEWVSVAFAGTPKEQRCRLSMETLLAAAESPRVPKKIPVDVSLKGILRSEAFYVPVSDVIPDSASSLTKGTGISPLEAGFKIHIAPSDEVLRAQQAQRELVEAPRGKSDAVSPAQPLFSAGSSPQGYSPSPALPSRNLTTTASAAGEAWRGARGRHRSPSSSQAAVVQKLAFNSVTVCTPARRDLSKAPPPPQPIPCSSSLSLSNSPQQGAGERTTPTPYAGPFLFPLEAPFLTQGWPFFAMPTPTADGQAPLQPHPHPSLSPQSHVQPPQSHVQPSLFNLQPAQSHVQPPQSRLQPTQSHVRPPQSHGQPPQSHGQPSQSHVQFSQSHVQPSLFNLQPTQSHVQPSFVPVVAMLPYNPYVTWQEPDVAAFSQPNLSSTPSSKAQAPLFPTSGSPSQAFHAAGGSAKKKKPTARVQKYVSMLPMPSTPLESSVREPENIANSPSKKE